MKEFMSASQLFQRVPRFLHYHAIMDPQPSFRNVFGRRMTAGLAIGDYKERGVLEEALGDDGLK